MQRGHADPLAAVRGSKDDHGEEAEHLGHTGSSDHVHHSHHSAHSEHRDHVDHEHHDDHAARDDHSDDGAEPDGHDSHAGHSGHSHDEHDSTPPSTRIIPSLDSLGQRPRFIEVTADSTGFSPRSIEVDRDERVVLVFANDSDEEHHFHVMGLDPEEFTWFTLGEKALGAYDQDVLLAAERAEGHICISDSGYCRLGTNIHLHADPKNFDAVSFIARTAGTFEVSCPIHQAMSVALVVRE